MASRPWKRRSALWPKFQWRVQDIPEPLDGHLDLLEILEASERAPARVAEPPAVVLVVGVNGSGKTTTIGKLASRFKGENRTVLLCAADTFRAAAIERQYGSSSEHYPRVEQRLLQDVSAA